MFESSFNLRSREFKSLLAATRLTRAKLLGAGRFSAVYDNEDGTVTKFTTDNLWIDYALHCGPRTAFAPALLDLARDTMLYAGRPVSVAILPRYTAVMPNSPAGREAVKIRRIRSQEQRRLFADLDKNLAKTQGEACCYLSALLNRMVRAGAGTLQDETCSALRVISRFVGRRDDRRFVGLDMHVKNFMLAPGGQLVLSDPLVNTDA
ncbi:hypothetical protein [Chromobacterium sp. ASV23]|uniref:hypothetical protein n=1 Tax=Chromobacterium sp. ASV23 TaxID=2795110 RepID=UPI0018ECF461|nr:hypothetical protein [Chromobacterium sp. ASV23]